jgi:chromosome segregation ATPase
MEQITFDTESGISEEEQQEILTGLDKLTETEGHTLLVENVPFEKEAKKRGLLFPILVNVAAVLLLAGGLFVLLSRHNQDQMQFQQGDVTLGSAERKLIEEIRKETAGRISAKDAEIAGILAKLNDVDSEIQNLQTVFDESAIPQEQLEVERGRMADLQKRKEEYQSQLESLQEERGKILEEARIKETNLHNQIADKTNELEDLSTLYEQTQSDLGSAQDQLRKITDAEERATLIDRQLEGYYASLNSQIKAVQLNDAASTLQTMKNFLNTPSFQNIQVFQRQKEARLATIDAITSLINASLSIRPKDIPPTNILPDSTVVDTPIQNPSDSTNAVEEAAYEKTIANLKTQNTGLEKTIADRDRTIKDRDRTIDSYKNQGKSLSTQEKTINDLQSQIDTLNAQNTTLQRASVTNTATISDLQTQIATLNSLNTTLRQTASTSTAAIDELKAQNTALQQSLTARENVLGDLRTQGTSLQQTIAARETTINELRMQNSTLQQTVIARESTITTRDNTIKDLQNQITAIRQLLGTSQLE